MELEGGLSGILTSTVSAGKSLPTSIIQLCSVVSQIITLVIVVAYSGLQLDSSYPDLPLPASPSLSIKL